VKIQVLACGRLGRSEEARLAQTYADRASALGRALGLGPVEIREVEARRPGRDAEAEVLLQAVPDGAYVIACDEHGAAWASRAFAAHLAALRDAGERRLSVIIGGADGLSAPILAAARERLAFGPQTWPHALARTMACEQIYRAVTILAGSPYHRD
jgi:23S rRNA (pseudouridine1915-N3)-methyltransferase